MLLGDTSAFADGLPATGPLTVGARGLGGEDDSDGGIYATLRESNTILHGITQGFRAAKGNVIRAVNFDPDFNAETIIKEAGLGQVMSDPQLDFVKESSSLENMLFRIESVNLERDRVEAMGRMSGGSLLFWGMVGGFTDLTSYIPIIGQGRKAVTAARIARTVRRATLAGKSVGQASRAALGQTFKRAAWESGLEGAAFEAAFQSVLQASRIERDEAGVVNTSVALTGAVSGLLGGGLTTAGSIRTSRRFARRAGQGLADPVGDVSRAAQEQPFGSVLAGSGPGAASRARLAREIDRVRSKDAAELKGMLLDNGVVGSEAEADELARLMLSKDPAWLNPLGDASPDTDFRQGLIDQLSGSGNQPQGLRNFQSLLKLAKQKRLGLSDDQIAAVKAARNLADRRRALADALRTKASEDTSIIARASDVKAAVARTLNRPRQNVRPQTAETVAADPAAKSPGDKVEATRGLDAKQRLFQFVADARNATANWASFKRNAFGRGMFRLVADEGDLRFRMFNPLKNKTETTEVRAKKASLGGNLMGRFRPDSGEIEVDADGIRDNWETFRQQQTLVGSGLDPAETDVGKILDGATTQRVSSIAHNPDEMADFVFLHELAHQKLFENKALTEKIEAGLQKEARENGLGETEIESLRLRVEEAQANALALRWMKDAQRQGPDGEPDKTFANFDGMEPMPHSIEVREGEKPKNAIDGSYTAMGLTRKAVEAATSWLASTNMVARAQMSTSPTLRRLTTLLADGPFYLTGITPKEGSASSRQKMRWEHPLVAVRSGYKKAFRDIDGKKPRGQRIGLGAFERRVMRALAKQEGDTRGDEYSALVNQSAREYRRVLDKFREMGHGVGWVGEQVVPDGENWYRRMYRSDRVRTEDFVQMLLRNGIKDRDAAEAIQDNILSFAKIHRSEMDGGISVRGATKGRQLEHIDYDELAPFLNTNAFEAHLNAARVLGGEVEMRNAFQRTASEMGLDSTLRATLTRDGEPVLDEGGNVIEADIETVLSLREETGDTEISAVKFDPEPVKARIAEELDKVIGDEGLILDAEQMSLRFKTDWQSGSELAKAFPEQAQRLKDLGNGLFAVQRAELDSLKSEKVFANKWVDNMIATMQRTRDSPENPDSWWSVRLPTFIKNMSHMTLGGGLAVANVSDFHRSITEFGIKRAFRDQFKLLTDDLEAFTKRNKLTDDVGLALEHELSDVERRLRNATEHLVPETLPERLAERGATLMSSLNLMNRVANGHQRSFSLAAQGFILEAVPKLAKGEEIAPADVKRLGRMGIGKAEAKQLEEAFAAGGRKLTDKNTAYMDVSEMAPEVKDLLSAAVHKSVNDAQTVPSRLELADWQVQGWGGLLMMYRNWAFAANSRLMATALSNPDKAMLSGAIASVGLGALVVAARSAINNSGDPFADPEQFLRDAIDAGGFLGLPGEVNNLVSRMTAGILDANPVGTGAMRYYDASTALGSVLGPIWHWPDTMGSFSVEPDRHDVNRFKDLLPYNTLFYYDGIWNQATEGGLSGDRDDNTQSPVSR